MSYALRPVAIAGLVILASTAVAGTALAQLDCRVRFSCIGQDPCYYALFDQTGQRIVDFEVVGGSIQYQTGIAIGTSYCESTLGPPDEDCDRQPIDEDQFEC